jgi:hypothetical protein
MKDFSKNKKIRLGIGSAIIISCFLPYLSFKAQYLYGVQIAQEATFNVFDMAGDESFLYYLLPLCGIAAVFFSFKDDLEKARYAFIASLGIQFITYMISNIDNLWDWAGIGMYILFFGNIAGIYFSQEDSPSANTKVDSE